MRGICGTPVGAQGRLSNADSTNNGSAFDATLGSYSAIFASTRAFLAMPETFPCLIALSKMVSHFFTYFIPDEQGLIREWESEAPGVGAAEDEFVRTMEVGRHGLV